LPDQESAFAEYADLFRAGKPDKDPVSRLAGVLGAGLWPYPVVELGGGTGHGTLRLAELLPGAQIVTVEQSAGMRSALNARLAPAAEARRRVTVIAGDVFEARLPPLWSAAIAIHFVCQIDPQARRQLWRMLGEHLAPGAVTVLDRCFGPKSADPVPRKLMAEATAGANTYQRWFAAERSGPDTLRTVNTYRTIRDGAVVREDSVQRTQFVVTEERVLAEAAETGLRHQVINDLLVLTQGEP
jgi:trans-aconitate methyltransferase